MRLLVCWNHFLLNNDLIMLFTFIAEFDDLQNYKFSVVSVFQVSRSDKVSGQHNFRSIL